MEKLIELLNEYAHTYADHYDDTWAEIVIDFYKHTDQCFLYTEDWHFESLVDDVIISKRYWFIKWLTKNDYIDRDKIDELKLIPTLTYHNMMDDCDCGKSHWHPYTFVGDEDELLMLLAIDKNPIEFLISVLK